MYGKYIENVFDSMDHPVHPPLALKIQYSGYFWIGAWTLVQPTNFLSRKNIYHFWITLWYQKVGWFETQDFCIENKNETEMLTKYV